MMADVPGVLMTRVRRRPALGRRARYPASVRSRPPPPIIRRGDIRGTRQLRSIWKKLCLDGVIVRHYFDVAPH